jgi:hypothetical protein
MSNFKFKGVIVLYIFCGQHNPAGFDFFAENIMALTISSPAADAKIETAVIKKISAKVRLSFALLNPAIRRILATHQVASVGLSTWPCYPNRSLALAYFKVNVSINRQFGKNLCFFIVQLRISLFP